MERIIRDSGIDAQKEGAFVQATETSRQVGPDMAARKDHTAIPVVGDVTSLMKRGMIQQQSDIRDQGYQARSRRSHLMMLYNRKG